MDRLFCFILIILHSLVFFSVLPAAGRSEDKQTARNSGFKDRAAPTETELRKIFSDHRIWSTTKGKQGKKADLSGADLRKANLKEAQLDSAILREANLNGVNLSKIDLRGADLRGASLRETDLSGARLNTAKLSDADLSRAVLIKADLRESDLTGADISGTDLSGAMLNDSNLTKVKFQPDIIPPIRDIAFAENLSKLKYNKSRQALTELREGFKAAGLRRQEREVTYAINHIQRKRLWRNQDSDVLNRIESVFYLVFFELTCAYGMSPGRLILILFGFIVVFTIPYYRSLSSDGEDGIWIIWIPDRVRKDIGAPEPVRLNGKGITVLKMALYFSVLSAFSIGWRELNVGNWISRLQKYEYSLRATGWVRMASGLQSLISVYLLALWVLTFFGRPFETL